MSYIANQYNYATPLSSAKELTNSNDAVLDIKYFTLFDNKLDGTSYPISGDVGLWSTSLSDAMGILSEPFIVTVNEALEVHTVKLVGSEDSYPVDFDILFYNGSNLVYTISETGNTQHEYTHNLPKMVPIDHYVISISRISEPNAVARLYRSFVSYDIHRSITNTVKVTESSKIEPTLFVDHADVAPIKITENSTVNNGAHSVEAAPVLSTERSALVKSIPIADTLYVSNVSATHIFNGIIESDTLSITVRERSHILNIIDTAVDSLKARLVREATHPTVTVESFDDCKSKFIEATSSAGIANIHSVMKSPERRIYGKVYITYTDPLSAHTIPEIEVSDEAYNSQKMHVVDGISSSERLYFTLYENDLSGRYSPSDDASQVGWTSKALSKPDGTFEVPPYIRQMFKPKPIAWFNVFFDDIHDCVVDTFKVDFVKTDGTIITKTISGNTAKSVAIDTEEPLIDIEQVTITIIKLSKGGYPAVVLDAPINSTFLYRGYQDSSDLLSIDLLEELTYNDSIEALGGVSANEVTITLDNSSKVFNMDNPISPVARQLRRNRKIEPYLGAEIIPGQIEWYSLGTYWSYSWDVPYNSLTASVVGFDTLGLLDTTSFTKHHTQVNKSIGFLADYILTDATEHLSNLDWYIAPELYDVIIPYAWFEAKSHTAALRKLSLAYPIHIYCDRSSRICIMPQKLRLDYFYDVWSDDTNIIEKTYSSLYTVLPNIINVTAISPFVTDITELVNDTHIYSVEDDDIITLNFSAPYISDINVSVDMDSSLSYVYEVFSWGIEITFIGSGEVRNITCTGKSLDTSNTTVYTKRDNESIRLNGAFTRDVSADFIQTSDIANTIINRLFELSKYDKYDAEVTYRGDISLSINDPILLIGGIAPDNRYNIKRHQLYWDGSLSGTADLNT